MNKLPSHLYFLARKPLLIVGGDVSLFFLMRPLPCNFCNDCPFKISSATCLKALVIMLNPKFDGKTMFLQILQFELSDFGKFT